MLRVHFQCSILWEAFCLFIGPSRKHNLEDLSKLCFFWWSGTIPALNTADAHSSAARPPFPTLSTAIDYLKRMFGTKRVAIGIPCTQRIWFASLGGNAPCALRISPDAPLKTRVIRFCGPSPLTSLSDSCLIQALPREGSKDLLSLASLISLSWYFLHMGEIWEREQGPFCLASRSFQAMAGTPGCRCSTCMKQSQ